MSVLIIYINVNNMLGDLMFLNYILAFILIASMTFVEDIDILYNPFAFVCLSIVFILTFLSLNESNFALSTLMISLIVLVFVVKSTRESRDSQLQ